MFLHCGDECFLENVENCQTLKTTKIGKNQNQNMLVMNEYILNQ